MAKNEVEQMNPLELAHAARSAKAAERAKLPEEVRAKADYMELVNDACDRILNGGRRTIAGAVGRFSTVNRETGKSLLTKEELEAGLAYIDRCTARCREILAGGRDADGGFQL